MKYFLLFLILLFSGCDNKEVNNIENEINNPIIDDTKYIDTNPIKISLYQNIDGYLKKVDKFYSKWNKLSDIIVLSSVYTDLDYVYGTYFQDIFNEYVYEDILDYKIGYHVYFTLKDGSVIDKTILSPKDSEDIKCFIELFLYDDVHQVKGGWYSHVKEDDVKDDTIFTSIKVFASTYYDEINSDIILSSFVYKKDDLDEFNNYLGNSIYSVVLINE